MQPVSSRCHYFRDCSSSHDLDLSKNCISSNDALYKFSKGSNLLPFRLSGKGKNCGGKAKVEGRFSDGKAPVLTSINAKKPRFPDREGLNWGGKVTFFITFPTER